jgi:4-aminobutyrate aminotransferase
VTGGDGRDYLDFFAGILTNMVGYDLPEVRDAVAEQLAKGVVHTSTLYLLRAQVELAERIAALSGIPDAKVFFTSSGTEANEAALLLATTARRSNQVIALRNSYHGRTFATTGITGNRGWSASSLSPLQVTYAQGGYRFRSSFRDLDDAAYVQACVRDLRELLDTTTAGDVACLIAEPVQGVGGFAVPPDGCSAPTRRSSRSTASCSSPTRSRPGGGVRASTSGASAPTAWCPTR